MDWMKLLDSIETVIYEVFGLLIPGAFLLFLAALIACPYASVSVEANLSNLQVAIMLLGLYLAGILLNGGRRLESQLLAWAKRIRRGKKAATNVKSDGGYPDQRIFDTAKHRVAAYLGMDNGLSAMELFNLCLAISRGRDVPYRKFVSLRDMMRGIGFGCTAGILVIAVSLAQVVHGHSPATFPLSRLSGVFATASLTLSTIGFYAVTLLVLILLKITVAERESRYDGIARRIIYPIALVALKEAEAASEVKGNLDE